MPPSGDPARSPASNVPSSCGPGHGCAGSRTPSTTCRCSGQRSLRGSCSCSFGTSLGSVLALTRPMPERESDIAAIKDAVRRHWSTRAATFDDAPNHGLHTPQQEHAWQVHLRRWAGADPVNVLDIGCGTGFLALQLAGLGHRVLGIDAAREMLDIAQAKAIRAGLEVTFHQADAEHLPYEAGSFDLAVERHVLWT